MPKVAIITGAGSGIGRACAIDLSHRGYQLVIAGRTGSKLEATASQLATGCEYLIHCADLRTPETAKELCDATLERFGRVDCIVNCAGIAPRVSIDETTPRLVQECWEANAFFPACLMLSCWKHLKSSAPGRVVNVSSLASTDPFPGFFAYAASKAALDSFTRSSAREVASDQVKVFSLNLGCVETPLLRSFADHTMVPPERALPPETVAVRIAEYLDGSRDHLHGKCVELPGP